jgi:hypothetical protein
VRLALALLVVAACSKASDESRTKRSPTAPPPPTVEIPANLSIAVSIDGVAAAPLDAARLTATRAEFVDEERRAWRLTTLVPAFDRTGATVEAEGASGATLKLTRPDTSTAMAPVLFLTRRGEVMVTLLDPAHPFPDYHGQGGRLRRPGDDQLHLSGITALRITAPAGGPR